MRNRKFGLTTLAMSVLLIVALVFPTSAFGASAFSDVAGHWSEKIIADNAAKGIISGYPDGTFKPDAKITNAEVVSIYNNYYKVPTSDKAPSYTDVAKDDWFYQAVADAEAFGYIITTAPAKGKFNPNANITRQDAFLWLYTLLGSPAPKAGASIASFADAGSVGAAYQNAFKYLVGIGMLTGYPEDNTLRPGRTVSRSELLVTCVYTPGVAAKPEAPKKPSTGSSYGSSSNYDPAPPPSVVTPPTVPPTTPPPTEEDWLIVDVLKVEDKEDIEVQFDHVTVGQEARVYITGDASLVRVDWQIELDDATEVISRALTWSTVHTGLTFTPGAQYVEKHLRVVITLISDESVQVIIDLGIIQPSADTGVYDSGSVVETARVGVSYKSKAVIAYDAEEIAVAYDETPAIGF